MAAHLRKDRYADFWLTDAVRPSPALQVIPRQGYRIDRYRDAKNGFQVPVLAAAVSREHLFDAFLDLLDPLGDMVDVVLETSHDSDGKKHLDLFREGMELTILKSYCLDFEDLLLNDGCTGIAVLNPGVPLEVQFDEHKLLIVYGNELAEFEQTLADNGLACDDEMKFITEAEHVHSTSESFYGHFQELTTRLGMDSVFDTPGREEMV